MRLRPTTVLPLLFLCFVSIPWLEFPLAASAVSNESNSVAEEINAESEKSSRAARSTNDSFADMIDRALEREFPENEQNQGCLNFSLCIFFLVFKISLVIELGDWILNSGLKFPVFGIALLLSLFGYGKFGFLWSC